MSRSISAGNVRSFFREERIRATSPWCRFHNIFFKLLKSSNISKNMDDSKNASYLDSRRLLKEDLDKSCIDLALYLLGKVLVHKLEDNTVLKGRIVETESYLGGEDRGSNTYKGRRTEANEPMYMSAGTCYVYMTYGMYHCFNISSMEPGAAVLLRAIEPLSGQPSMESYRAKKSKSPKSFKPQSLCDGPSKLCISFNITKQNTNKIDLTDLENDRLWLEDDPDFDQDFKVIHSSRIGINRAGEWNTKPLRFYILDNNCVSKRDKEAEIRIKDNF